MPSASPSAMAASLSLALTACYKTCLPTDSVHSLLDLSWFCLLLLSLLSLFFSRCPFFSLLFCYLPFSPPFPFSLSRLSLCYSSVLLSSLWTTNSPSLSCLLLISPLCNYIRSLYFLFSMCLHFFLYIYKCVCVTIYLRLCDIGFS